MMLWYGSLVIDIWQGQNADQGGSVHFSSRFAWGWGLAPTPRQKGLD
jgi:hypothetical protein